MKSTAVRQNGLMLPVAIFLLVILAALVGYAMRLSLLANMGTTQDVQGTRAYLAARAGVEWAAYKVLSPGSTSMQTCPTAPSPFTINGFNVTLTCTQLFLKDKGDTQDIGIYTITSKAASVDAPGTRDYIEREIKVTLSRCIYNQPNGEECN
jgi:MSHA biogenesis protein MshP